MTDNMDSRLQVSTDTEDEIEIEIELRDILYTAPVGTVIDAAVIGNCYDGAMLV